MLLVICFAIGYLAIVFEHPLRVNKTVSALIMGVICWTVLVTDHDSAHLNEQLLHHFAGIAQIVFFLLGAMVIVELIDAHDGFELITSRITTTSRRKLLLVISILSFLLSAVLDNLTTSIVMISLVRKLTADDNDRLNFGGIVIIAANAGGVWSPIGDVTTTMLWVGNQVTTTGLLSTLIVPALVCVSVPIAWVMIRLKGNITRPEIVETRTTTPSTAGERTLVFSVGTAVLVFVPVFKTLTGLPPVMGILLGLGVLWAVTEVMHKNKNDGSRSALSAAGALQRIDSQSVLFFLGILLAIGALETAGTLRQLSGFFDREIGNIDAITLTIGLSSAVIDNVPLVAASQGMYPIETFGTDHHFWLFLAYCAGTGGSILIIGSAAGIAVMGIQRITFGAYVKRFSLPALLGYFAGALAYLAMR
ncbi:MAG: sodium:proton antiporter NhaD [Deltaproteobacteria bacterium]|nr:sodium:proton antiporter NhaD [Deltaproteobacteria bacterium]